MRKHFGSWAKRAVAMAAVPCMGGLVNGCMAGASTSETEAPREGAFATPAGFAPQFTARAAMAGFTFARDEARRVVTSTVAVRRAARARAGLAATAKGASIAEGVQLEAEFDDDYTHGMRVAVSQQPDAYLKVTPLGAQPAKARVRGDGALVAFEGAYPNVTSVFGGHARKVEEFLSIPTEADVPTLRYRLEPGPAFGTLTEEDGSIWAFANDGAGLFSIAPPFADDATGKRVTGSWRLEPSDGGAYTLTAAIDLKGLAYPVLLDPSFETPQWFTAQAGSPPSGRAAAAGAYDLAQSCVVMFGGALASFSLQGDVNVRCSSDQQWQSNIGTSGTAPSARAYHAMAWGGDGTYVFGGYTAAGLDDGLYKLTLAAGGGSGTWTQVAKSGSWPVKRFLHGAAWTGSRLMIWGGVANDGTGLRDVWEWDGSTWTQKCATCFGGSNGLYGFAYTTTVNGGTRRIYSMGGYDNPLGGGSFVNQMTRWNGSSWVDVSGQPEKIPVDAVGNVNNSEVTEPPGRYLHWVSATDANNILLGSGTFQSGSDVFPTDSWQWIDRSGEVPAQSPQWLRTPTASAVLTNTPGARESATAVFDETLRQVVLFGGLTASQATIQSGRVYKGDNRNFTMTQTCTDDGNGDCAGNVATLTVTLAGLDETTTPKCSDMQGLFLRQDVGTSQWGTGGSVGTGLVTGVFSGGTCTISKVVGWAPASDVDLGVRLRDKQLIQGGTRCTTDPGSTEVANGDQPACPGTLASLFGSGSCGGLVSPALNLTSITCRGYLPQPFCLMASGGHAVNSRATCTTVSSGGAPPRAVAVNDNHRAVLPAMPWGMAVAPRISAPCSGRTPGRTAASPLPVKGRGLVTKPCEARHTIAAFDPAARFGWRAASVDLPAPERPSTSTAPPRQSSVAA